MQLLGELHVHNVYIEGINQFERRNLSMPKIVRSLISAVTVTLLLFSTIIFLPDSTKACPPPIPATLLELYLTSDLIVLADVLDENIVEKTYETEEGFSAQVRRNLRIINTYKGKASEQISFIKSEYRSKETVSENSDAEYSDYEFELNKGVYNISIGHQYLFFLTKDEAGKMYPTDYLLGIKNVAGKLDVFERNFAELNKISASRKNKLARLTEWLVKGLEEPETLWDNSYDLNKSLSSFEQTEDTEEKIEKDFVLDQSFNIYNPAIIQSLSDSQKARISNVLINEIQKSLSGQKNRGIDYNLTNVAASWDQLNLAIYGFGALKSLENDDADKKDMLMQFLTNVVDDRELYEMYYEFSSKSYELSEYKNQKKSLQSKEVLETKQTIIKTFDNFQKRFEFMLARNFEPVVEEEESEV